jgi:hypothetical protein
VPDQTQPQSPEAVVRRYLRVFETCRVADLQELVAEDVLIHGAGQNVRDLTMTGIKSCRVADGRIVEFWGETDLYGLLRQAGLVPDTIPTL